MEDIQKLLRYNEEHLHIPLADWDGKKDTQPVVTPELIAFNGVGEDSHESFVVEPKSTPFEFCKTNRKSYNLIVGVCLFILSERLGEEHFNFSSDGRWGEEDGWDEAAAVYEAVFGREISPHTRQLLRE